MSRPQRVNEEIKPVLLKPKHAEELKALIKEHTEKNVEELVIMAKEYLTSKKVGYHGITPVINPNSEGVEVHMVAGSYTYTRKKA